MGGLALKKKKQRQLFAPSSCVSFKERGGGGIKCGFVMRGPNGVIHQGRTPQFAIHFLLHQNLTPGRALALDVTCIQQAIATRHSFHLFSCNKPQCHFQLYFKKTAYDNYSVRFIYFFLLDVQNELSWTCNLAHSGSHSVSSHPLGRATMALKCY